MPPDGRADLARAIDQRAREVAAAAVRGLPAELGTITASGLKLDGFRHELPGYLVASYLTLPDMLGPDTHGDLLSTPEALRALQVGDRVLVLPVNHGQEHVVIARVVPGAELAP